MTRVLPFLAVLAGTTLLAPAARADPSVTLFGLRATTLKKDTVNGQGKVTLTLILDRDTKVEAVTRDVAAATALTAGSDKRQKAYDKRSKEVLKEIDSAAKAGNEKKAEELKDELTRMAQSIQIVPAVVQGTLAFKDDRWRLTGGARPFAPDGKDKGVAEGTCVVEGEAVKGAFTAGEFKSSLGVRVGKLTVVMTGPPAKEAFKGAVRATGTLRLTEPGGAVLEADTIEAVKK
jgi:hypothetical protein